VKGKIALTNWWKEAFEQLPSLNYKVSSLTADTNRVFMEYTRSVEGETDLLVAEVLEIKEEKIIFSRVYHG
jgi:predicted SnoaL-like aldol condensation-catalyzing enzyme